MVRAEETVAFLLDNCTYRFRNKRVEFKINFVCFLVLLFSATILVGVWNMYDCDAGFGLVSFGGGPVGCPCPCLAERLLLRCFWCCCAAMLLSYM